VVERLGCDRRPIDPLSADGRLALLASVWADQTARFARVNGAIELARRVPATVETSDVAVWLPRQLEAPRIGIATVVYHSIFDEYLPEATRTAFYATLREAGDSATTTSPLFWVRLEPSYETRSYGVTVTRWPGGDERLVAHSGAHGTDVRNP
jgi:hypothetical protein